ncbi:plasmid pRiA4b ORF-3 family protein [Streptomyces longispororuber]|uniref:plasmid pRiA4b ORF-3 family protein n=1 Tax=Streptomyces longispororuber TaxID=68230 RepID=UPI00210B557C|nr:plasmid pRiA4b ORF-3 family protein [Streptomyces longispororuber]MCQ4213386.1 plasmid pRiA4b ORF-3 family protein [Streptomyces longispororuber]
MTREQWWSVRVELTGGGMSGELWPRPGRIFAVSTRHTLHLLAEAIDDAFARWDRSHLHEFDFPTRGKRAIEHRFAEIEDPEAELDADHTRIADVLQPGDQFGYVFDLGDQWRHACQTGAQPIDPLTTLGIVPHRPMPYWGWGTIPDPYGRMWDSDDGEHPVPNPPHQPWPWPNAPEATHLTHHCPGQYTLTQTMTDHRPPTAPAG